jgi:hypothetical protein
MGRLNESARIRARHYHKVICENISFSSSHLNEDYYSHYCPTVKHMIGMRRMHVIRL